MNGFHVLMYHELRSKERYDRNEYQGIEVKQGYHDVLPEVLFCYVEEFEKQMKYLKDNGYITISLSQVIDFYYNNKPLPDKSVLLTFDDLYQSILKYAYPILKKYQFHAVGFLVNDWLFDSPREVSSSHSVCLSKEDIQKMNDVFEYANHTSSLHTRNENGTALQTVDKDTFLKDIAICEEVVPTKRAFAYPYGVYTQENIQWLKEFGTLLGFTSENGFNSTNTNPYELYRNAAMLQFSLDDFKKIFSLEP